MKVKGLGVVLDDEDWPRRFVETLDDAVQVDEGRLALHGRSQPDVVAMVRIGTAIAIAEKAAIGEAVIVGALAVLDWRGGRDGEGDIGQNGWLEDALGADQGNSCAFEVEAAFEDGAGDGGFAEALTLLDEEGQGAQADCCIAVVRHRDCGESADRVDSLARAEVASYARNFTSRCHSRNS
jgi:hypothetical protein